MHKCPHVVPAAPSHLHRPVEAQDGHLGVAHHLLQFGIQEGNGDGPVDVRVDMREEQGEEVLQVFLAPVIKSACAERRPVLR
jgi:hypothetical protein